MDTSEPAVAKFLENNNKLNAEVYEQNERVRQKAIHLQELLEKQIQIKRLLKRNKNIEKSIRKRFATYNMDVDFQHQKCGIPFILAKLGQHETLENVEHDGASKIKLHSSIPIGCLGDAQVLNIIYPPEIKIRDGDENFTSDFTKLSKYMPYSEFSKI